MADDFSPAEFGAAWNKFIRYVNAQAPSPKPSPPQVSERVTEFLGADPASISIVKEGFPSSDLPNLQIAIDRYLAAAGRSAEEVGYTGYAGYAGIDLAMIFSMTYGEGTYEGPVQYRSVELAGGERLQCMAKGLYFVRSEESKVVVGVRAEAQHMPMLTVEVASREAEDAERFLAEIRRLTHEHSVYRGHVISLASPYDIHFHSLPQIERESIILPERLLSTIERNTLGFTEHAARLRAAGRHVKRGLLFHGRPGTGKTLTIMYLASQMKGRTVILLTGQVMGLINQSCRLARQLAPATVVLEDVDLVAQERDRRGGQGPLLFELLNEMDGLAPDVDVMFILSSNRPDLLEPALAARPGRIDQAIEFPMPDAGCRRRLFGLYGRGLSLRLEDLDGMVSRTKGTSPAFIRELLRKAALIGADDNPGADDIPVLTDAHLREALHAIIAEGGQLTKTLLGVAPGALED